MNAEIVAASDIYQGLTEIQVRHIQQATREIHVAGRIGVRSMIAIGKRLAQIKEILAVNGQWRRWLTEEFENSHDSADRFIRVAENFPDADAIGGFQKGALYFLSEINVPQAARDVAIARAEDGQRITRAVAEQIVSTFHKAAADMVEEALTTEGSISLAHTSVGVVSATEIGPNGEVKNIIRREVIEAGLMETVAETLQYDKDRVIRHIVKKGASLGRVDFIAAGEVADLEGLHEWLDAATLDGFEGQIFVSVWGIPKHE